MHSRYTEWINFVFDHPVEESAWYWDIDYPMFEGSEEDYVELIRLTFTNSGNDLSRFSDAQVNQGIWFLVSTACSDYMFSLKDSSVDIALRVEAIESIYLLYKDCFQRRCSESLSHLDHKSKSELNPICYMFWDVNPLGYLKNNNDEERLKNAVFSVLKRTLMLPHLACKEAAIHGYGEFHCFYPEQVEEAMEGFLKTDIFNADLKTYATDARVGNIL